MLQIVYYRDYSALAAKQHRLVKDILPERGTIFAQDKTASLVPLALNRIQKNLIATPRNIKSPGETAALLEKELGLKKEGLLGKLEKKDDAYEIIAKDIEPNLADKIEGKLPEGLFFEEEKRRIYPHGSFAANLLGFVSIENTKEEGRYGLERYYEDDLSGERGFLEGAKDATGFWIAVGKRILYPPKNGSDLILTADYNIQKKSEETLLKVSQKWAASSGLILVTEPKTGRILAQAVTPAFDPNEFSKVKDFSRFPRVGPGPPGGRAAH